MTEIGVLEDKVAIVGIGAPPTGAHPSKDLCRWGGLNPKVAEALLYCSSNIVIQAAARAIVAGDCEVAVCIAARNPPGAGTALSGGGVYDAAHGLVNANVLAGMGWAQHMRGMAQRPTIWVMSQWPRGNGLR